MNFYIFLSKEIKMKFLNYIIIITFNAVHLTPVYSLGSTNDTPDNIKVAAEQLRDDFANLGEAIKTTTAEQANATIDKIKDWVQNQDNTFKAAQANLQARIEETKRDINSKINAIATATESNDEAKANALLKELEADINSKLQNLQEAANAIQSKFAAAQQDAKTKWSAALEDLQTSYQNNLRQFKNSLNETKVFLEV